MYLASRGNWASLTTKPLALFSPELRLNVLAPYGELAFQVTDLLPKPTAGKKICNISFIHFHKYGSATKWPLYFR